MKARPLNRREFLRMASLAGLSLAAVSCSAPSPAPQSNVQSAQATASQPTTAAAPVQPTSAPTVVPAVKESVEISQWDSYVTQGEWMDNEIKLFREKYPWISIKRINTTGQVSKDILPLAFTDKSLPDMFSDSDIPLPDKIKNGYLKPLSDFADFEAFKQTFPNPAIDFVEGTNTIDGKTYTAPRERRSDWWNQVYVNMDVLKAAGIEQLPDTADQFLEACRAVVKTSAGKGFGYGLAFSTWMTMLWQFAFSRSVMMWGQDYRTGHYLYASDTGYRKVWETLGTLSKEGLILPEAASIDDEGLRAMFAEGKVAFITAGIWTINGWKQTHPNFTNYTVVPPFTLNGTQRYGLYPSPGGGSWHISSLTEHPEETWLWYKWCHSKETMERWVKSGNGFSLWPESNQPDFFKEQVWKDYIKIDNQINHVGPVAALRNPVCGKLNLKSVTPDESGITGGVYSGAIALADIPVALKKLNDDKEAAFQQAIDDLNKAENVQLTFDDWAFPDWDPAKDYVTQRKA